MYSTRSYDRASFDHAVAGTVLQLTYLEDRLTPATAPLAQGADAVCIFVNDVVDDIVLGALARMDVGRVALRSAGFNHVDLPPPHRPG